MTLRRIPMLLVAVLAVAGAVTIARRPSDDSPAVFSVAAAGWMPAAPSAAGLTETWFCPGVPAAGAEGVGGSITIASRTGEPRPFSVVLYNEVGNSRRFDSTLAAWAMNRIDVDATLPGAVVGAVVEIDGGGAVVEQHAEHPLGDSFTPCTNSTSGAWYFADGFTVEQSVDQIVLANPYDQTVVAQLEFATQAGTFAPGAYSGLTVPPLSTRVVDLGAPGAGAQGEPLLAVSVTARTGRLVVGRVQQFVGGGREGTNVTLGSPAAREQWWFANGQKGGGVTDTYVIYNPTDDDAEVDAIFIGTPTALEPDPITVPPNDVVTFDPATVAELPEGRYSLVFGALTPIVVERVTTRTVDDVVGTSVVPGATPRQDGYLATRWYVPAAPAEPTAGALVVLNADNAVGTVTVSAIGGSGPVPVPELTNLELPPPNAQLVIDLTDPIVAGRALIVEASNRVFVERAFPTGRGGLAAAAWAVPAA